MPLLNNELISVFYRKPPTYNPIMEKRTTVKAGNKKHSTATNNYGDYSKTFNDNQTDFIYPSRVIENIKCVHNSSNDKVNHPTQKPVELCEYLIETYTNEGETVLDMTMGSGSTGVACKNIKRDFIGIEMNDKYYDIACKRVGLQYYAQHPCKRTNKFITMKTHLNVIKEVSQIKDLNTLVTILELCRDLSLIHI